MSKSAITAAPVTAGGLGLIYFKPAGTIINQETFLFLLQACPITIEVEHRFEPEFHDSATIPNLRVDTELRLSVAFNLENNNGLLESKAAEVGLFKVTTEALKSFSLALPPAAEPEVEQVPDEAGGFTDIINFVTTSQVLAQSTKSDSIDTSPALAMLSLQDPATNEPLRSESWFEKLGVEISKYGRCTAFILEAGEAVLVEPGVEEEAVQTTDNVARQNNPLRININEDDDAKPVVPSITREQLEAKRTLRQEWMEIIRKRFRVNNSIVYRIPLSQLEDFADVSAVVHDLIDQKGEQFDVFIQQNVTALIESAIVRIG